MDYNNATVYSHGLSQIRAEIPYRINTSNDHISRIMYNNLHFGHEHCS